MPNREGRGLVDDPVKRPGGRCAVEHCRENAVMLRITNPGYAVLYCRAHEIQASKVFDKGDWEE